MASIDCDDFPAIKKHLDVRELIVEITDVEVQFGVFDNVPNFPLVLKTLQKSLKFESIGRLIKTKNISLIYSLLN